MKWSTGRRCGTVVCCYPTGGDRSPQRIHPGTFTDQESLLCRAYVWPRFNLFPSTALSLFARLLYRAFTSGHPTEKNSDTLLLPLSPRVYLPHIPHRTAGTRRPSESRMTPATPPPRGRGQVRTGYLHLFSRHSRPCVERWLTRSWFLVWFPRRFLNATLASPQPPPPPPSHIRTYEIWPEFANPHPPSIRPGAHRVTTSKYFVITLYLTFPPSGGRNINSN